MIIKNNFNTKSVNPLNDYNNIGKGSHSLDKEFEREKEGFIRDNMNDPILKKLRGEEEEKEENKKEDKWDFFR